MNVGDGFQGFIEVDFNIPILAPLLGEDLDAIVFILMRSAPGIVTLNLMVQNDGGSSRRPGLTGHLKLFR